VRGAPGTEGIYIGTLDGSITQRLLEAELGFAFASGHIFFIRQNTLFAQPFDTARLTLTHRPRVDRRLHKARVDRRMSVTRWGITTEMLLDCGAQKS
jgi:hypothetical protein